MSLSLYTMSDCHAWTVNPYGRLWCLIAMVNVKQGSCRCIMDGEGRQEMCGCLVVMKAMLVKVKVGSRDQVKRGS